MKPWVTTRTIETCFAIIPVGTVITEELMRKIMSHNQEIKRYLTSTEVEKLANDRL